MFQVPVYNVAALQPEWWEEIVQSRIRIARKHQLSEEFILNCYQNIHEEAIRRQSGHRQL